LRQDILRPALTIGRHVSKEKLQAILKYEINNENNFAMVATFVEKSRNEVLTMT